MKKEANRVEQQDSGRNVYKIKQGRYFDDCMNVDIQEMQVFRENHWEDFYMVCYIKPQQ